MTTRKLILIATLAAAACSGKPSSGDIEHALEAAWKDDWVSAGRSAGVLSASEAAPGASRGAGSSARLAVEAAEAYGGKVAGSITREVIGTGAQLAGEFGVSTDNKFQLNAASKWDVTNLEVIDGRISGSDYVTRVRYDVYAVVSGKRLFIGRDLVQSMRLNQVDGDWIVAFPS
jgi:hypothetical protein